MISIIIPVYQVSEYVERCIRSVMTQTYTDFECIIVDDATRDDSIEKCNRLIGGSKDTRFRIVHHKENLGLSAARNTGTKLASGEYLFYLDSDDEITLDCLEKLMSTAQKYPDAEIVVGNTQVIVHDEVVRVWIKEDTPCLIQNNETIASYYHNRLIPNAASNKLIKSSFIEEFGLYFREGIIHEDILWMFHVVKYLSEVALVKDVTHHYCIRPGSISTGSDAITEGANYLAVYDEILHNLTEGREDKELNRYVNEFCKSYLKYKTIIPAYKGLRKFYYESSRTYHCWHTCMILVAVGFVGQFHNPEVVLEKINRFRYRVKR